jgi:hypothetical protein
MKIKNLAGSLPSKLRTMSANVGEQLGGLLIFWRLTKWSNNAVFRTCG